MSSVRSVEILAQKKDGRHRLLHRLIAFNRGAFDMSGIPTTGIQWRREMDSFLRKYATPLSLVTFLAAAVTA